MSRAVGTHDRDLFGFARDHLNEDGLVRVKILENSARSGEQRVIHKSFSAIGWQKRRDKFGQSDWKASTVLVCVKREGDAYLPGLADSLRNTARYEVSPPCRDDKRDNESHERNTRNAEV